MLPGYTIDDAIRQLERSERGRAQVASLLRWLSTTDGLDSQNRHAVATLVYEYFGPMTGTVRDALSLSANRTSRGERS